MTAKDKEYVDRQHNLLRTDITSLQDRIIAIEGKPVASSEGSITVELDKIQLQTILNDCLRDYKLVNGNELQCLIDIYNDIVPTLNKNLQSTDKRFELIRIALIKILGINTNDSKPNAPRNAKSDTSPATQPNVESIAKSGARRNAPSLHCIKSRPHAYLSGHFTLPRGYTLLTIILYLSLLFLTLFYRISFTVY